MKRIFAMALSTTLCLAPGVLILVYAAVSKTPAGHERVRLELARDWSRFPPADRASCLSASGRGGTYTGLLACLELKRDARRLPKEPDMPTTVGQGNTPLVR